MAQKEKSMMLEAFRELYGDVTTSMSYKEFYDQCLV